MPAHRSGANSDPVGTSVGLIVIKCTALVQLPSARIDLVQRQPAGSAGTASVLLLGEGRRLAVLVVPVAKTRDDRGSLGLCRGPV